MRKMKDSGIEWIGKIPSNWDVTKLKFLGNLNSSGVDKKIVENETLYKSIQYVDVYRNSLLETGDSDDYLVISANETKAQNCKLKAGDVLFTNSSETPEDIGHSTVIKENLDNTLFGYHLMRFRPSVSMNVSFEKYIFGSDYIRKWFGYRAKGITRYGILTEDFANVLILVPPIIEQEKIAHFLDDKCRDIDNAIQIQQKQIEVLKEYKQSAITEAVTKGLNENVPMKNSGVEWIGKIPQEWEVRKARTIFEQSFEKGNNDLTVLSSTQNEGVIPKELLDGVVQHKEDTDFSTFKAVRKYDYVISLRSFQGGFEMSEYNGVITPAYSVFRANIEINPYYFKYFFKTGSFISKINSLTVGIREGKNIKYNDFAQMEIVLPTISEQTEIAKYVNDKSAEIDKAIEIKQGLIDKLAEYKKSLIFEVVTGKMSV